MDYNDEQLEIMIYMYNGKEEEREVILGVDGSAIRTDKHRWEETNRLILKGDPNNYADMLLQDDGLLKNLIIPAKGSEKPYVGRDLGRSIQFGISASSEQRLIEIASAMVQQKQ